MTSLELAYEYRYNDWVVRYGVLGEGPPLVACHGTPWSSYNLRHLIASLSSRYTVYYYDMLGYGLSDKPDADVSLGVQNALLTELLELWKVERPVAIGHDYGGATVLRAHLLNGQELSRLILIDPVALSPWGSEFLLHARSHREAFEGLPAYLHKALVEAYVGTAIHGQVAQSVVDATVAPWLGTEGQAAFYRQLAQADDKYTREVEARFETIRVPTLLLWGAEDRWIPVDRGYRLADIIPGARLSVVPEAGHLVIEERPEALLEEIWSFLS